VCRLRGNDRSWCCQLRVILRGGCGIPEVVWRVSVRDEKDGNGRVVLSRIYSVRAVGVVFGGMCR